MDKLEAGVPSWLDLIIPPKVGLGFLAEKNSNPDQPIFNLKYFVSIKVIRWTMGYFLFFCFFVFCFFLVRDKTTEVFLEAYSNILSHFFSWNVKE